MYTFDICIYISIYNYHKIIPLKVHLTATISIGSFFSK